MSLVTEVTKQVFQTESMAKGTLVYAKHSSWNEGRSGFVTDISETEIVIQYFPVIGSITNHFMIEIDEVKAGKWEIRWSKDLQEVQELQGGY